MADDRAGLHYVCIVQNTELRSLMQGDDQKIEPVSLPGTDAAERLRFWFHDGVGRSVDRSFWQVWVLGPMVQL